MRIINFPGQGNKPDRSKATKEFLRCELKKIRFVTPEICSLTFSWHGPAPKAGQFFMIKPERTSVFLGRPISVAAWHESNQTVEFLIAVIGTGTTEICNMLPGEIAMLTGPLGNSWEKYLSILNFHKKPIALVGGGLGIAPLQALVMELPNINIDFYAGLKTGFLNDDERNGLLGPVAGFNTKEKQQSDNLIIATEDGSEGYKGFITDFFEPQKYDAVCTCGPLPMMEKVAALCKKAGVYCFVSMEQYMACGVGACLGCTVKTKHENRRCCADGPIFPAEELVFNE